MKTNPIAKVIVYMILILGVLVFITPFIYMILTTFVKGAYSLPRPSEVFSAVPNLDNYEVVWTKNNFFRFFLNSLLVAGVATVGSVFFGALTAYAFVRFTFPFKEFIFRVFIFTMMIPLVLAIVPQFTVVKSLGLVNTYYGLWLIYIGGGIVGSTFFLRGFFEKVPKELVESIVMDGGGNWRIFWNIYLPLSKPALGTMAIFAFSGTWDEYFVALTIIKDEMMRTLPIALMMFQGKYASNWSWIFAASIIAILPVIIIYIIFQKKFVQGGMNEGSVKG
ncbi:carbohydrate ABC transporter permease [Mesobacillus subterraneus]|uniref:carbohydrate ABC transporter permease n=1 Tax=Mesobacillus subterraneus TaxID=285983 RepID=UPI002041D2BB|nr:carbohydrate ABC transporter permease [Mesobacillus subterraneus]MCM3665816.1 carbohydrate ABC transporter permease [Mesobacillus subterraneus]MCM3684793.1 carbohydrate ABC transporter permease [Mesobacillus subterraneus]